MISSVIIGFLLAHVAVYAIFVQYIATYLAKEKRTSKQISRAKTILVATAIPVWQQVIIASAVIGFFLGAVRYGLLAVWRGLKSLFDS